MKIVQNLSPHPLTFGLWNKNEAGIAEKVMFQGKHTKITIPPKFARSREGMPVNIARFQDEVYEATFPFMEQFFFADNSGLRLLDTLPEAYKDAQELVSKYQVEAIAQKNRADAMEAKLKAIQADKEKLTKKLRGLGEKV